MWLRSGSSGLGLVHRASDAVRNGLGQDLPLVADAKLLKVLANVFKQSGVTLKNLKTVVYIPDEPLAPDPVVAQQIADALALLKKGGVEVLSFEELRAKGRAAALPRDRADCPTPP